MVVHAVPVQRCVQVVQSLTGVAPSVGWVHGLLARTAEALVEVDKRIRTRLTLAYAVCCDETPIRVGPRRVKRYLLVACTGPVYLVLPRRPESGHVQRLRLG